MIFDLRDLYRPLTPPLLFVSFSAHFDEIFLLAKPLFLFLLVSDLAPKPNAWDFRLLVCYFASLKREVIKSDNARNDPAYKFQVVCW